MYIASSRAAAPRIQCGAPLPCCAHDVVRRRLPLNVVVIVLAHHVYFAQVQKSPQGGHKIFGFREEPITTDARFSRRRATLVRRRLPPPRFSSSRLLSPSGTIVSARGTTQVKCCRPSPQPASRWSPPSPLPLPPWPSWYLRIRCCALLPSAVSRESAEQGPAGGGRAWGACCPVDAVGGP